MQSGEEISIRWRSRNCCAADYSKKRTPFNLPVPAGSIPETSTP
jgi:hypothetical protein